MEPTARSSTMSRQVWTSTPVDRSRDVVTSAGYGDSGVDEVAELPLPVRVGPGDAHDVAGVPVHEIGVLVDERLTHAGRVFLVDAEHNRFLEAVPAVLQILRDLPGDERGAVIQDQRAIEVPGVVEAIIDFDAVSITLSFLRTVAFHIAIDMDFDDLVGGEKAVGDALPQGVRVDGLTEVLDVRDVCGLLGGGREADLRGPTRSTQESPARRNPRRHCHDGTRRSR